MALPFSTFPSCLESSNLHFCALQTKAFVIISNNEPYFFISKSPFGCGENWGIEKMGEVCLVRRGKRGSGGGGEKMVGPGNFIPGPTKTQCPQIGEKIGEKRGLIFYGQFCPHFDVEFQPFLFCFVLFCFLFLSSNLFYFILFYFLKFQRFFLLLFEPYPLFFIFIQTLHTNISHNSFGIFFSLFCNILF